MDDDSRFLLETIWMDNEIEKGREQMSLSDKGFSHGEEHGTIYFKEDVREAVKELKKRLSCNNLCYCEDMPENDAGLGIVKVCDNCYSLCLINEIFGKELTEGESK